MQCCKFILLYSELGTEGIVANIWNTLPLMAMYAAAALKLHRFIQSQAGWGRGEKESF